MIDKNDLNFDKKHMWHPYTSLTNPIKVYGVESAKGVWLTLADGKKVIDGMSSWWAVIHGHNHPVITKHVSEQLHKMSHVMFGGITHKPAVELCRLLVENTPEDLTKVFLADSGSVSVEVALKMAVQFWQAKNKPEKSRFIALRNAYHGDTFGAMSVCDPVNGMHSLFSEVLMKNLFADAPQCKFNEPWFGEDIQSLKKLLEANHKTTAAVIIEPIVQGAGGMRFYSPEYIKELKILCDKYDTLLIFDEIATGFGRTGKFFALEHAEVTPDILCLGKAITGGYMTLSATLTTDNVSKTICSAAPGVFMHGPTFMGNPLACAAAVSSINLLLESPYEKILKNIEYRLKQGLEPCREFPNVFDVRVLGGIGVVEMKEPVDMNSIQKKFIENNVWIRPFGKLVYIMPPYITTDEELNILTNAIQTVLSQLI